MFELFEFSGTMNGILDTGFIVKFKGKGKGRRLGKGNFIEIFIRRGILHNINVLFV